MKKIYFNPKEPGSFGGIDRLWKATGGKKCDVKKWLLKQDTYTLHKPVVYHFQRRKTISYGINELWQADLLDVSKFSRFNKSYRYILTIIDVMSRFLRAYPIKNKKASTVAKVFQKLFKQNIKPVNLQTDGGKEFYNHALRTLLNQYGIHHYSTKSEAKCAILERAHRTLRARMHRVFTHRNSYKYYDVLQSLIDSYNQSIHRAHGFKPAAISTKDEATIYKRLYEMDNIPKFRFNVADSVRISKANKQFRRGYLAGWTEEVFRIKTRFPTNPPTYILEDFNGKEIDGRFYTEELQKIYKSDSDYWAIEKIIRSKGSGSSRQHFVKFVGFDDSFNTWIKQEWIKL